MAKPITFTVIAAVDNAYGLGKDGDIPWILKGDRKHFKEVTCGKPGVRNAVIMGRKTYFSLPEQYRPLPGRLNIVLTREKHAAPGALCIHAYSLADALLCARLHAGIKDIFVIGGGEIYAEAFEHPDCDKVILTSIGATYDCDTFFPALEGRFDLASTSAPQEEGGVPYVFQTYKRKQS